MNVSAMHCLRLILGGIIAISVSISCKKQDEENAASHYNAAEISKLPSFPVNQDTVKFVLVSDIHNDYNLLSAVIEELNQKPEISFLICCGDLTHDGVDIHFDAYVNSLFSANFPVFSVAGNHDYLSSGNLIFREYFGRSNFTFRWGPYKFIVFDDAGGMAFVNTDWLEYQADQQELMNIVIAHKPPWDTDQESAFRRVSLMEQTILFLHGHTHEYAETTFNGVPMLISTQLAQRKYYIVSLCGRTPVFKTVSF